MKIGFVPRFKRFYILHGRVFGIGYPCAKDGSLMTFESSAHQLVELRFITETPTGTMNRHKPTAILYKVFQVFPLVRLDCSVVCVQQEHVKFAQVLGVSQRFFNTDGVIKINRITSQCLGEHRVVFIGVMMLGRVPQKQHADRAIICLREHQAKQKQNRDKESGFHFEWNKFRWRVVVGQHVKGGCRSSIINSVSCTSSIAPQGSLRQPVHRGLPGGSARSRFLPA